MKTILDMEMDFGAVVEMYGGFPLREDFLAAGNAALEALDLKAVVEDGEIRIPFLSRPFYSEEDLEFFRNDGWEEEIVEEVSKWILKGDAVIRIGEELRDGILEADMTLDVEGTDVEDKVYPEEKIDQEDLEEAVRVMETFLNLAVDVD